MIIDKLENASRYRDLSPAFAVAFDFLLNTDLDGLELGRHEIACEARHTKDEANPAASGEVQLSVFANVMEYETVPGDQKDYENHFDYIDLQYVVGGSEFIFIGQIDQSSVSDEGQDCCMIKMIDSPVVKRLAAGDFALVWPGEPHKPGVLDTVSDTTHVKKVVVKIPVGR